MAQIKNKEILVDALENYKERIEGVIPGLVNRDNVEVLREALKKVDDMLEQLELEHEGNIELLEDYFKDIINDSKDTNGNLSRACKYCEYNNLKVTEMGGIDFHHNCSFEGGYRNFKLKNQLRAVLEIMAN